MQDEKMQSKNEILTSGDHKKLEANRITNMINKHQPIQSNSTAINTRINKLNLFVTVRILLHILSKENPEATRWA